ncbi:benzodiazepine receptor binding [Homalodisca vitripennis]|nr:benzodiazepine receptor binding [Homalodisca vitripennis]
MEIRLPKASKVPALEQRALSFIVLDGRMGVGMGSSGPATTTTADSRASQPPVTSKYKAPPNPILPPAGADKTPVPPPQAPTTEPQMPNLMQKLTEMTGGDNSVDHILSKGKELIFMKFGLGK